MAARSANAIKPVEEIAAAISRLSAADRIRLVKAARHFACHWTMSPDDLLQEAIFRALEGSRHCPCDVPVIAFLAGIMRSLSSTALRSMKRQPKLYVVPMVGETAAGESSFDPADGKATAEEALIAEAEAATAKAEILDLYSDDVVSQALVEGIMEGMKGQELRELTGLTEKELATKRRLIRRRRERTFPGGV